MKNINKKLVSALRDVDSLEKMQEGEIKGMCPKGRRRK